MKDVKMKQLMNLAEQLDKYVSNFPYQVNVLSETHTFNNMHTVILARFLAVPTNTGVVPVFIARLGYGNW